MRRVGTPTAALLAAAFLAAGCTGNKAETNRGQVSDDFSEKVAKATVGDNTVMSNTESIPVSGVGLVWKLPGTGSAAKAPFREFLEKSLRQKQIKHTADFLDPPDKSCSLVLVNGLIPPGARKGDPIDIEVTLPAGTDTTSLKGGVLFECELFPYERAGKVRDQMVQAGADLKGAAVVSPDTILLGQPLVRAAGPLVAGNTEATAKLSADSGNPGAYRVGMVWGGGRYQEDRAYWFIVADSKTKSARMTGTLAARLNESFPGTGGTKSKTANAVSNEVVMVQPPSQYRLNHSRFILVARHVPMVPMRPGDPRRQQIEQELLDPKTAIAAAVKLEALGAESQATLRVGLEHASPWVRFASAEALAYLGNTAAAPELAKLAEQHPGLRTHCLTALATLDDGVSTDRLTELMTHPDPQLRYGAFAALRAANDRHPGLNGKHVKNVFWLHTIAPDSAGLIHMTGVKRAEIVLFGAAGTLRGDFSFPVGTDIVVARRPDKTGKDTTTVARIIPGKDGADPVVAECQPTVGAVLNAIGELGGGYSEAVEFVRRANAAQILGAAVAVDSAPRGIPIGQLLVLARTDPGLETANLEVARASRADAPLSGYDLPGEGDAVKQAGAKESITLSRNPGRLFGPKRHPDEPDPAEVEKK